MEQITMHDFFKINDAKYEKHLLVNMKLMEMKKEEIHMACQIYGIKPMTEYFDGRAMQMESENHICGFLKYMNAFLIEVSGGKRNKLLQIGKELTGEVSNAFSMRLIRADIITSYLHQIVVRQTI